MLDHSFALERIQQQEARRIGHERLADGSISADVRRCVLDIPWETLAVVVVFGPVVGVGFSLMALRYTAAGIASTLQALTPILLILPSHWMFGEKLSWRSFAGALVSVAGVSLFFLL